MEPIRLIAMDMDGTLLGNDLYHIPEANREALREASERGVHLALVSGRLPDDASFFALDAGLPMHVLALNGSCMMNGPMGETVNHFIPEAAARKARAMLLESGLMYCLFSEHELVYSEVPADLKQALIMQGSYMERPGGRTRLWIGEERIEPLMGRVSKFTTSSEDHHDLLVSLWKRIEEAVPEVAVTSSGYTNIEVIPRGVHKGAALRELAASLGIPMSQVMAIGDNDNDIPMLREAGCAVAMGNAVIGAKNAADWITLSHVDHGVAVAVRALVLGDTEALARLIPTRRQQKKTASSGGHTWR